MPDTYKTSTKKSYGSRIGNSIKGILIGLLLFAVSFVVLYINEGRVDLSKIAKKAVSISSAEISTDVELQDELIVTRGIVESDELLGDGEYLNPDEFLVIYRTTEMYAWVEHTETETKKNLGGSETEDKTYTYTSEWVESVADSTDFYQSTTYENPDKTLESGTFKVTDATVGVYKIDPLSASFPGGVDVTLSEEKVTLENLETIESNKYIFDGFGTFTEPEIGDMRISYRVVNQGKEMTIFGKLSGEEIIPYIGKKDTKLYRLFNETKDEAIATMHSEFVFILWIMRLVGFLLMFGGLSMIFQPISVILDVVPMFGSASRFGFGLMAFIAALILSIVTIVISAIIHNIFALIAVVLITAGIITFIVLRKKKK